MQENLNTEIRGKLGTLQMLAQTDSTLHRLVANLHEQSERLVLASNGPDADAKLVNAANAYYRLMSKAVTGQCTEPLLLYNTMSPVQIQLAIKQNELWLLNNLIYLNNNQTTKLFSVVEKTLNWH